MADSDRLLAYATGQAAVVAVLAGVTAPLALFTPLGLVSHSVIVVSDPATLLATRLLRGLVVVVGGLYVLIPIAVAAYLGGRGDRRRLYYAGSATLAVLGLPALLAGLSLLVVDTSLQTLLGTLASLLALAGLFLAHRIAAGGSIHFTWPMPRAMFFNTVLVAVFVLGVLVGLPIGSGPASGLVEQQRLSAPQVAFESNYTATDGDRGVLTITHEGGDALPVDEAYVEGSGFASVDGVDQTEAGRWSGESSGGTDGERRTIEPGDSVDVGATTDCELRVVYEHGPVSVLLAEHRCSASERAD